MAQKDILDKLAEEVDKIDTAKTEEKEAASSEKKVSVATKEKSKPQFSAEKSEMAQLLSQNPVKLPEVGEVIKGKDVVDKINSVPTGAIDRPLKKQVILKAIVKE